MQWVPILPVAAALMLGNGTDDEWAQWAQDKFSPLQSQI